ncbi:helix-turn-helix domain-containing protein [Pseudactinotalea sp. HY160]|nr:helix-turn-helix domain-containing protein [Pseudactinotalea sp. HY160]
MSPAKRAELIADYVAGMPVAAIASKFRVHRATVPELGRRAGVPIREAGLPAGKRAQAASLYAAGMTLAQVAERVSIDVDTVRAAVLAEGGPIRPRGRRPRKHPR